MAGSIPPSEFEGFHQERIQIMIQEAPPAPANLAPTSPLAEFHALWDFGNPKPFQ